MQLCKRCGRVTADRATVCPDDGGALEILFQGPPIIGERYRLIRCLGRGGMGLVLSAEHLVLKRQVAVKVVHPDRLRNQGARSRFRTEAEALGRLSHPAVVQVIDYGIDERAGALPYLVMELLSGQTLATLLAAGGPVPPDQALPMLSTLATALDHAHTHGVLHRDLKPANVMVPSEPGTSGVKLLDLGIAHLLDDEPVLSAETDTGAAAEIGPDAFDSERGEHGATASDQTRPGVFVGTTAYAAPEVLAGARPTTASDIYSFAVVVFETLSAQHPFPSKCARGQAQAPSVVNPLLPREIDPILLDALSRNPSSRPLRASSLVASLRQVCRQLQEKVRKEQLRARRRCLTPILAAISVLIALLVPAPPPLQWLDRQLLDLCFSFSEPRQASELVLLVVIDDSSLDADPTPLAELGQQAGELLGAVLDHGARAIGIDLLLPQKWTEKPSFTRLLIRHRDRIALAESGADGRAVGPEVVSGLVTAALGQERAAELFAVVDLDLDPDGAVRRFRPLVPAADRVQRPTFAARLASLTGVQVPANPGHRLVDLRVDTSKIPRISWCRLAAELEQRPSIFDGRVVLVGADFAGSGDRFHQLPGPGFGKRSMTGVELQAVVLSTLLSPDPVRDGAPPVIAGAALVCALAVTWIILGSATTLLRSILAGTVLVGAAGMLIVLFRVYGLWLGATQLLPAGLVAALLTSLSLVRIRRKRSLQ